MTPKKLCLNFYRRGDVVQISKDLIGKVLCTQLDNQPVTAGIIVETEAYCGRNDKACHANDGLRTDRTEIMYHSGGVAYIYLCYGIHHLFNVVTNVQDNADAVLVRAIQPLEGIEYMLDRRKHESLDPKLSAGPGRLTQALGITTSQSRINFQGDTIWIEDREISFDEKEVVASPRIGVDYAGDHARRPWRFYLQGNKWVSQ
jgi:DNA-3-methyladenine glycosylase